MWGSGSDPGGPEETAASEVNTNAPGVNQELIDLKDQFEQQKVLIAQLKEMLRKSEQTSVTEEKLEVYANTLTRMSARAKKNKKSNYPETETSSIDTPAKEKILYLRQQVEENKLKLEERKKVKKGIEETVTQLKAQLDDSQISLNTSLFHDSKLDISTYDINTSHEELLNALALRDKKLADQTAKIQKLEANVLDLQENVKEKDSVIDARTKAITLMSESLSKKGKTTLDALDDTKEQMRKMQENFVELEFKMRQENETLTTELNLKVEEIARLKTVNAELQTCCDEQQNQIQQLEKMNAEVSRKESPSKRGKKGKQKNERDSSNECKKHVEKLTENENTIKELQLLVDELKVTKVETIATTSESEDITKLRKQLDESNKGMIKVKAQNKGKIKELSKKIEDLKNESKEEIEQLQKQLSEQVEKNSVLQKQNASIKDQCESISNEQLQNLERKVTSLSDAVENRIQQIAELEQELDRVKHERNDSYSPSQVESQLVSIHLEEQIDRLEKEKKELIQQNEAIQREKDELVEKLDALGREKHDLMNKLDNYVQENMDLIDKLEKLSAEKVSSAESIEIVEGLTQQEKLELEAYQKSLNLPTDSKTGSENSGEDNQELNESVNQLTEETSDLLRKIELFTEERREVMDKMDNLTFENSQLIQKIREIENNLDILSETYEQLQNEKEQLENKLEQECLKVKELETKVSEFKAINQAIQSEETVKLESVVPLQHEISSSEEIAEFKALVEIQKIEIQELKLQLLSQKNLNVINDDLNNQLFSLQSQYESLRTENENLHKILKESGEHVHEKNKVLETELKDAQLKIEEMDKKLSENMTELEDYKVIISENKEELIATADKINNLQLELLDREKEVLDLNTLVEELQETIIRLENLEMNEKEETFELMSNQLQELKILLHENLIKVESYEKELNQSTETTSELNNHLSELNIKLQETERELKCKNNEIKQLEEEKLTNEKIIEDLKLNFLEKEKQFHQVCSDLKEKYLVLQTQIEKNADCLDNITLSQVKELETKNKEQLDKMKKIAANLKRKSTAYQELEEKFTESQQIKTRLEETTKSQDTKIGSLLEQLEELENAFLSLQKESSNTKTSMESLITERDQLKLLNAEFEDKHKKVVELQDSKMNSLLAQLKDLEEDSLQSKDLIDSLTKERDQLQNMASNYALHLNQLSESENNEVNIEINEKNMTIEVLKQEIETLKYDSEVTSNALQAKIQELEMVTENQELELNKYKERVSKLEEGFSVLEERRLILEQKNVELDEQLREKSTSFEEISQVEDILEQRLASLMAHDENVQRNLNETIKENQQLLEQNRLLIDKNDKLNVKLIEVSNKHVDISDLQEKIIVLQSENVQLSTRFNDVVDQYQVLKDVYEKKQNEIEIMETELQGELEKLDNERKIMTIECEKLKEQLAEYCEVQQTLNEDIELYKIKLEQLQGAYDAQVIKYNRLMEESDKTVVVIENLKSKISHLEHERVELNKLNDKLKNEIDLKANISDNKEVQIPLPSLPTEISENLKQEATEPQSIATFVWPDSVSSDPFDFVQNKQQTSSETIKTEKQIPESSVVDFTAIKQDILQSETSNQDELLKKIKTLEFMLYSVEKEKEDILLQCQSLTHEISRLIYERQSTSNLESQVCSSDQTVLTQQENKQLKNFEFTSVKNPRRQQEGNLKSENLYLCYDKNVTHQNQFAFEQQVVSPSDTYLTQRDLLEIRQIEFEEVKPCSKTVHNQPTDENLAVCKEAYLCYPKNLPENVDDQVVTEKDGKLESKERNDLKTVEFTETAKADIKKEEPVTAKSAYLCYQSDSLEKKPPAAVNVDTFDDNDDGWGCGIEEVKLEEDHRQIKNLEELDERVRVLELERERHLEEIRQAQVKSGKLIKKLKEFKNLNDKLNSELKKSDDFGGLDDTIVEEFKEKIVLLEKRIKESVGELEKEKGEKQNLLKKVETLQNSNDKFKDLKDRLDVEIISYQRENHDLRSKLDQFEWGNESFDSPRHEVPQTEENVQVDNKKIEELVATVKELTLDNEELQTLLEEQRSLRLHAEKAKSVEPILENMKSESEYLSVVSERNILNEQLLSSQEEKKQLQSELNELIKTHDNLQTEKQNIDSDIAKKSELVDKLTDELNNFKYQHNQLQNDIKNEVSKSEEANTRISYLEAFVNQLQNETKISEKNEISNELDIKNAKIEELSNLVNQLNQNVSLLENKLLETITVEEKTSLKKVIDEKNVKIEILNKTLNEHLETINDLESKLIQINSEEIDRLKNLLNEKVSYISQLDQQLSEITDKVSSYDSLKIQVDHLTSELNQSNEDKTNLNAAIEKLNQDWSQKVDQRGSDVAESWKLHLDMRETEFAQTQTQLRNELTQLDEKYNALVNENNELRKNVDTEIRNEVDRMSALQQQVNERDHYINELTKTVQDQQKRLDDQIVEHQNKCSEKTSEIQQFENRILELTEELNKNLIVVNNLQSELLKKEQLIEQTASALEVTKRDLEESRIQGDVLEQKLAENDIQINELRQKLLELQGENEIFNQQIQDLSMQLGQKRVQEEDLSCKLDEVVKNKDNELDRLKNEVSTLNDLLKGNESINWQRQELEMLNSQMKEHLEVKENELQQFKSRYVKLEQNLQEKENEYSQSLSQTAQENEAVLYEKLQEIDVIKRRQNELENHYSEILQAKEEDMESLRLQHQAQNEKLQEFTMANQQWEEHLNAVRIELDNKTKECEDLTNKAIEQEILHSEENKQLDELRLIIEDQVLKIESLKEDLFQKSNDYDALIAELEIRKAPTEIAVAPQGARVENKQNTTDDNNASSRVELDLAHYMLHQRDVRCEELTLELMQLLEERDILQLKLSNAIREKEAIRSRFTLLGAGNEVSGDVIENSDANITQGTNVENISQVGESTSITEVGIEASEQPSAIPLENKLSELKSVGYRRDKTLLDEQEQRRIQQLSLMQQHRDLAALLPPEAAARLVQDANFTLSRDVQSPSKVLLNWLWGKSTPKVNDV